MNDIVIRVENVGKIYRIGSTVEHNKTFREAMTEMILVPWRSMRNAFSRQSAEAIEKSDNHVWALRDISFEVKQGEVVGIIGRNGSGKSTLLKILSRITEPTEGRVFLRGRVGSLLEVGTGFHSELTGQENIYLSGSILGMSSNEISRRFDEIVAFAEVEKFIHTPVKHYSSGMYMRLAFAVAAHFETEILLVDEVLAVGDDAFQKKCLGKMGDVAKKGRTVLFVSHNMGAIEGLCTQAYLLKGGRVALYGKTDRVVSFYLTQKYQHNGNILAHCPRTGNGKVKIISFHVETSAGEVLQVATSGNPTVFAFEFENLGCDPKDQVSFSFSVHTDREFGLFHYYSHFSNIYFKKLPPKGYFKCLISELPLAPGNYLVMCRTVLNGDQTTGIEADWPRDFLPMTVMGGDFYGTGNINLSTWGSILVKGIWSMVDTDH